MPEISTRAEAREQGLKRYFTGKPCKHGHVAERVTESGACYRCSLERNKAYLMGETVRERRREKDRLRPPRPRGALGKASQKERSRRWYEKNSDSVKKRAKEWKRANRESALESDRKYRARNKARERERRREWAKRNPERAAERTMRHYARKRGAAISSVRMGPEIAHHLAQQGGFCAYCLRRAKLEADHVTALASGGSHSIENIVGACRSCNAAKADRSLAVFLARLWR